jgi:hypothetical protein
MPTYRPWMLFLASREHNPKSPEGASTELGKRATMLVVPTRSNQTRRKSMQGTFLFALGIIGAIVFAVTGSIWVACAAVVLLVTGVLLLYQVGRSLP